MANPTSSMVQLSVTLSNDASDHLEKKRQLCEKVVARRWLGRGHCPRPRHTRPPQPPHLPGRRRWPRQRRGLGNVHETVYIYNVAVHPFHVSSNWCLDQSGRLPILVWHGLVVRPPVWRFQILMQVQFEHVAR